ncbi:hypothetical protein [Roseospira visakhapatnamensis]|uniref:Uncharacterized protein n=1 Tax=Roseospira visakhapatnamensis TaxID=390880 RepID=A0A7W6RBK4_9PROT|nr:hypothetical protein [Roseospira visakhapatnamensis]MBB4264944.1 hypothetical protein [Roseospira visakhapatnamensis]
MSTLPELPNPLFASGRSVLARFGYQHRDDQEAREDWAVMWDLLRGDFSAPAGEAVPAFHDLDEPTRGAARDYMVARLIADRNLERCERLHVDIFANGVNTDAVERYAIARDAYEDSVEAFGAARLRLATLLARGDTVA